MQNHHLPPSEQPATGLKQAGSASDTTSGLPSLTVSDEETYTEPAEIPTDQLISTQGMEASTHDSLLDKLIGQARKQKRWRRISSGFYYTGLFSYMAGAALDLCGRTSFIHSRIFGWFLLLYFSAYVTEIVTRQRWGLSVARLTNVDDVRAVGALAEALDISDKGIRDRAKAALTLLLPRLQSSDAYLLNEVQRNSLYQHLKIEKALTTPDFMVALLAALEKVGDAGALPAVQALAACTVTTANGKRVQAAAAKCLPALRLRIRTQETSSTLLRASSAADTADASLLRPAHGGTANAPEELLRAANSDSEPSA